MNPSTPYIVFQEKCFGHSLFANRRGFSSDFLFVWLQFKEDWTADIRYSADGVRPISVTRKRQDDRQERLIKTGCFGLSASLRDRCGDGFLTATTDVEPDDKPCLNVRRIAGQPSQGHKIDVTPSRRSPLQARTKINLHRR